MFALITTLTHLLRATATGWLGHLVWRLPTTLAGIEPDQQHAEYQIISKKFPEATHVLAVPILWDEGSVTIWKRTLDSPLKNAEI